MFIFALTATLVFTFANAQIYVCDNTQICDNNLMTCLAPATCNITGTATTGVCCTVVTTTTRAPTTTTAACVDRTKPDGTSDCSIRSYLCADPVYNEVMDRQCRRTCGRCNGTTPSYAACVDKVGPRGISECSERKAYCNNILYFALMTEQCPRTCNRCNGTSSGIYYPAYNFTLARING